MILPLKALDRTNFDSRPFTPWQMKLIPISVSSSRSVNRDRASNDERIFSTRNRLQDSATAGLPANQSNQPPQPEAHWTHISTNYTQRRTRAYRSRADDLTRRRTTFTEGRGQSHQIRVGSHSVSFTRSFVHSFFDLPLTTQSSWAPVAAENNEITPLRRTQRI